MTDEEKAKKSFNKHITEDTCYLRKAKINIYKDGYLDGLEEGRKEKCLDQNKDGRIRPCEVMKENEELKEQIEKMKNNYKKQRNRRIDELQKKNKILKNIISTILDKEDICYICKMKGQVLPECMRMENSECLKNMISLWSK